MPHADVADIFSALDPADDPVTDTDQADVTVDDAAAFTAAWVLGLLTQWLRLSPIVGYLLAGVAIGTALVALVGRTDAPVELDPKSIATVALSLVIAGVIGSLVAFRRITQIEPAIALGVEP